MADDKEADELKKKPLPPGHVERLPETPPEGVKVETLGVPYFKDKFLIVTDENEGNPPDVLVFTVPIKKLALEQGRSPLAMLLGEVELFKGEAHKLFKQLRSPAVPGEAHSPGRHQPHGGWEDTGLCQGRKRA